MLTATTTQQTTTKGEKKTIITTECPQTPCNIFYSDIFDSITVRCINPSHNSLPTIVGDNHNDNDNKSGLVTSQDHHIEDPTTTAGSNYNDCSR